MRSIAYSALYLMISPAISQAHYLWIDATQQGKETCEAKLLFGEYNHGVIEKKGGRLDPFAGTRLVSTTGTGERQVPLTMAESALEGSVSGEGVQLRALSDDQAVVDLSQYGIGVVRPVFSARGACLSSEAAVPAPASSGLDVVRTASGELTVGKEVAFKVFLNGEVVPPGAKVFTVAPNGWMREIELEDGKGVFTPLWPGLHVVDVVYLARQPGTFKDVEFEAIRYRGTLSLQINK